MRVAGALRGLDGPSLCQLMHGLSQLMDGLCQLMLGLCQLMLVVCQLLSRVVNGPKSMTFFCWSWAS